MLDEWQTVQTQTRCRNLVLVYIVCLGINIIEDIHHEAQLSRDTKGRRDEEQKRTTQTPHMKLVQTSHSFNIVYSLVSWNHWLIVLGFNDASTLVGHFVSSPWERE